jgi:hypothetical protein
MAVIYLNAIPVNEILSINPPTLHFAYTNNSFSVLPGNVVVLRVNHSPIQACQALRVPGG